MLDRVNAVQLAPSVFPVSFSQMLISSCDKHLLAEEPFEWLGVFKIQSNMFIHIFFHLQYCVVLDLGTVGLNNPSSSWPFFKVLETKPPACSCHLHKCCAPLHFIKEVMVLDRF